MDVLLIPSAALIPNEMQFKFGKIPSSLYPYHNMAMLEHIFHKYQEIVDKVFVVAHYNQTLIKEYISIKGLPIEVIELNSFKDIGYTIWYALNHIFTKCNGGINQLYVNFGDTLTENSTVYVNNSIVFADIPYDNMWTFFKQSGGVLTDIIDKYNRDVQNSCGYMAFVGEFKINNTKEFYSMLINEMRSNNISMDSFYTALMKYSIDFPFVFQKVINWVDVGHNINSLKAKMDVKAREFNTINIDENRGLLMKSSDNIEKFIDEVNWYLKIPTNLCYLTPRVYDYSLRPIHPYIVMEYCGYPTLHELFVYSKLPESTWMRIFEKLKFIISDLHSYNCPLISNEIIRENMRNMYITKTQDRLMQLHKDTRFTSFFDLEISINDKTYPSLTEFSKLLPQIVEETLLDDSDIGNTIIHGDLCFTNILVEMNYNFIRLIDPRGQFGAKGIYGDPRYDIAKLLHCIDGGYDYIIEDMVNVERSGNEIKCHFPTINNQISSLFKSIFGEYLIKSQNLKLIESLLFLSMIPLHSDSVSRQYAMLSTGVKLFWEAI